jgi:DNA mismatch repair ATPase MutS
MHDIERLVARISLGTAGPRDLVRSDARLRLLPACTRSRPVCRRRSSPASSRRSTSSPTSARRSIARS